MRVGIGFDTHRFKKGRPLILGGLEIPYHLGLDGHSDADVILHALMDALLGAASLGDIGKFFPDTEKRYRGISSLKLLEEVKKIIEEKGYCVGNIDITVILEKPKLSPYREKMKEKIAKTLNIEKEKVSIKATTTEGLGYCGREEGIAAQSVVLLKRVSGHQGSS